MLANCNYFYALIFPLCVLLSSYPPVSPLSLFSLFHVLVADCKFFPFASSFPIFSIFKALPCLCFVPLFLLLLPFSYFLCDLALLCVIHSFFATAKPVSLNVLRKRRQFGSNLHRSSTSDILSVYFVLKMWV